MTTGTTPRLIPILLIALLALLLGSYAPAQAQGTDIDPDEILQRTDDILGEIRVIVRESDSEQARRILHDAETKQAQAVEQLNAGRPLMAVRSSLKAREVARQAERIALGSHDFQERARRYLERLQDMHRDVKDRAQESGNQQALTFVHRAENLFVRARDQFEQTHYERAFRLLEEAEKALKRAARLLLDAGDAEGLERELDRTANLIAVAKERLGDDADPMLLRKLNQAGVALAEARQALRDDDPLLALRRARHARQLAQQVLRQSGGEPDAEAVEREFERFDVRQEELVGRAERSSDVAAVRQLVQARGLRQEADRALKNARPDEALRIMRSALNFQRQAAERLK